MALVPPNTARGGYPLGLTGATAATRYVGATASGAPASGTFAVGDFSVDQSGAMYVCTVAGSPGTWVQVGASASVQGSVRVFNSGAFALTTAVAAAITFDSERYDSDAYHSTGANTSRLTVPAGKAGVYSIFGTADFAANAVGVRGISVVLNGATAIAVARLGAVAGGVVATYMTIATQYTLGVGDYVEMFGYQDSGGNLNIEANGNFSPEFGMSLVDPA